MSAPSTQPGTFVVSLDFELRWGMRDIYRDGQYNARLLGGRRAIPQILQLFERYGVHATWATVGILFARDRDELEAHLPRERPTYRNPILSPYSDLNCVGPNEKQDPLSYAPSLLDRIAATPGQEIGTHTFSHYYVLEPGQTEQQFAADLAAAAAIGARYGAVCGALVLPRNQWSSAYENVLARAGVRSYRVSRSNWAYRSARSQDETPARRLTRLVDTYLPVTGSTVVPLPGSRTPVALVASQFLRPFDRRLRRLDALKRRRLDRALARAAREGTVFHLWWHPHNFGQDTEANLDFLDSVLKRYAYYRDEHGMLSCTMTELAARGRRG